MAKAEIHISAEQKNEPPPQQPKTNNSQRPHTSKRVR